MPSFEETNNPNLLELKEETDKKPVSPAYQVGVTTDNRITLRIGDDFTSHTLTMNSQGARKLIRLLEAAMEPNEEGQDD